MQKRTVALLVLAFAATFARVHAQAQQYPQKPVRLVVAFAPGGANDLMARPIAQKLSEMWGQPVLVDNRPGGNSIIGTEAVARSPADGHVLLITPPAFAINTGLVPKLPYDALRDFEPISLLAVNPQALIVNPTVPARSVKELIVLAKARPGQLNFSSSGTGGANHLAGELFKYMTGVSMLHVPYKGNAPSLTALASGEVDLVFNSLPPSLSLIRSGRLRPLAVTSRARSSVLPDLPTLAETGLKGYEAVAWVGLSAPARTPQDTIARINGAVVKIIRSPEFVERLKAEGSEPAGTTPAEFAAWVREEVDRWTKVIRFAGVKAE